MTYRRWFFWLITFILIVKSLSTLANSFVKRTPLIPINGVWRLVVIQADSFKLRSPWSFYTRGFVIPSFNGRRCSWNNIRVFYRRTLLLQLPNVFLIILLGVSIFTFASLGFIFDRRSKFLFFFSFFKLTDFYICI